MADPVETTEIEEIESPVPAPGAKPASTLDRLKERRQKAHEEREPLALDIPGYGGELVAKYRVLDYDELERLQEKGAKMARAQESELHLKIAIDTIAAACVGFFVRGEDGELTPLNETTDELGEAPVRYDERLAQGLGIDAGGKVRKLVRSMFPTDLSVINHLERIDAWMSGVNEDDDADF